jgi:alpha-tubulin suppressor-like RCC1 family protein
MQTARYYQTATLLNNGQVLVTGGAGANGAAMASAELFNPATGTFSSTGTMISARMRHTATLLANGMVLVAGGMGANSKDLDTAELYDPTAKTFTTVAGIMTVTRIDQTATLFLAGPDTGKVLLAGGFDDSSNARNTAELFDPTSKSFTATTSMISAHTYHTATLLNDGTVLLAGGMDSSGVTTAVVELFDPTSGNFSTTGSLVAAREFHTSTLLTDGRVLVTGGANVSGPLASAELYK